MKKLFFSVLLLTLQLFASADVRLPAIIGSHMVLQQSTKATLWGWCDPAEKIEVKPSWDTTVYTTKGTPGATWELSIRTPKGGGPYRISIKGSNTIELEDVMVGEVWLCSGQSNMEMNMGWGLPYEKEAAEATNTNIRFFHVPRTTSRHPQDNVNAKWVVCSPAEMKGFSAVGYFFGKDVSEKLAIPVGLIGSSWGGTPAEVWTPDSVVAANTALNDAAKKITPAEWWPVNPGATYNAMIYPLTNFAIAGSLWYQGESNTGTWNTYHLLLTNMITSWRKAWNRDFPFYLVQIAPYSGYGVFPSSALLREQQTKIAAFPNTGMIVIHDLVDNIKDIHPKMKKEVGQRLAAYALTDAYGLKGFPGKYPLYKSLLPEGNKIRILFSNADAGLMVKGKEVTGFFIAGEDKLFRSAHAKIDGASVMVWSKEVKRPVAVRFGFTNTAMPNLYSKDSLPVAVFRTDNWDIPVTSAGQQ